MKRDRDLDILKGIAVVAMSFVHVNIFFLDQQAVVLDHITKWGAISCFTSFLLIVAILEGRALSKEKVPRWSKTLKRVLLLYIAYLIIAGLSWYISHGGISIQTFFDIAVFRIVPLLSEYLTLFIILSLLYQISYKVLSKISNSLLFTIVISIVTYLVGTWLYSTNILDSFWLKGLLVGGGEYNYFPIMQYLPIYFLGLYLGRKNKRVYFLGAFLVISILHFSLKFLGLSDWKRFPPSFFFLVESLFPPLLILAVLKYFNIDIKFGPLEIYAKDSLLSLVILTVTALLLANFFSPIFPVVGVWVTNLAVISLTGLLLVVYFKVKEMV